MSEQALIDRNKVVDAMQKVLDGNQDSKNSVAYFAFESIISMLKQEPTVDAVEVVRCKDCRESEMHTDFSKKKYLGCTLDPDVIYEVDPDHFCAYGEKR